MQSSPQQHDTLLRHQLLKPQTSGPAIIPPSSHSSGPSRHFFPLPTPLSWAYVQIPGLHFEEITITALHRPNPLQIYLSNLTRII